MGGRKKGDGEGRKERRKTGREEELKVKKFRKKSKNKRS